MFREYGQPDLEVVKANRDAWLKFEESIDADTTQHYEEKAVLYDQFAE